MALIRVSRGIPAYNIQIGPMHEALNLNPAAVLNVSDSFFESVAQYPISQWVPILETGKSWGYRTFFATKRILDYWCLDLKLPLVYVGCHGGIHRSVMTVFCWLLSLYGTATPEAVANEFFGNFNRSAPLKTYHKDVEIGYIPADLQLMFDVMRNYPTWSYDGILQSLMKLERITYDSTSAVVKIV